MVQAVFYKAGEIALSDNVSLRADNPGIILIKMNEGKVHQISVADPNRELGKMSLSLSGKISSPDDNFSSYWDDQQKTSQVFIDLPKGQYAGKSITVICN
jgi:chondroitin AC lyase